MEQIWSSVKGMIVSLIIFGSVISCSSAPPSVKNMNERKEKASDYLQFGQSHFQQGNYQKALEFFLIALDYFTAIDFHKGIVAAYNSIASTSLAMDRLQEARRALIEAEQLVADLDDRALQLQTLNGHVEVDLAENNPDLAFKRLSEMASSTFPRTKEGAMLFHTLGIIYKNKKQYDMAMNSFNQAVAINTELGLKQELAANHFMIASLQSKIGQFEQAESSLYLALSLDREMENTVGLGQDYRALGVVLAKKGNHSKAYTMLIRSNRIFQAAKISLQQVKTLDLLIPMAQQLGNAKDKTYFENLREAANQKSWQ